VNQTERLAAQLKTLESELHTKGIAHIKFNQQKVAKDNMSFSGASGRIWIQPVAGGYDISLSGKALTAEMSSDMQALCGASCNGYKQTNKRLGKMDQPYWRVDEFRIVKAAVERYAKTRA
jgi:hypothetical protein